MEIISRVLVAAALSFVAGQSSAADTTTPAPSRGQMLYQNHCTECHTSVAHVRNNRRATSVAAVEAWVRRWVGYKELGWGDTEITEVTQHLVDHYYRFDAATPKK